MKAVSYLENAVLSLELNFRRDGRIRQLALGVEWVFPPACTRRSRGRSWHGVILFALFVFSEQLRDLILCCHRVNGRLVVLHRRMVSIIVADIYVLRRLRRSAPYFRKDGPLRTLFFCLDFWEVVGHSNQEENWLKRITPLISIQSLQ